MYNSCQVLTRKRRAGENTRTGSAVTSLGEFCMCSWLQLPCTVPEWSQSNHCLHCRALHRPGLTPSTTAPQSGLFDASLDSKASPRVMSQCEYPHLVGFLVVCGAPWRLASGSVLKWQRDSVDILAWGNIIAMTDTMKPFLRLSPDHSSNERESNFQKAHGGKKNWMLTSKDDLLCGGVSSLRTWQCALQVLPLRACHFWVSFA